MDEFARSWRILLAATIGVGLGTTGLMFYSFGQFVGPLSTIFHGSRGAVSGGMLSYSFGTILIYPFIGRAVDRFGARAVALLSQIGLALGLLLISAVPADIRLFYAAFFVMSWLGAGTSPIVWTRSVARAFVLRRGLALGITLSGTGLAAILAPQLVGSMVHDFGWRAAFRSLAAAEIVIGLPVTFTFLREPEAKSATISPPLTGISTQEALRSAAFWQLTGAYVLIATSVAGLIVHLPVMLLDIGYSHDSIAFMLGFFGYGVIAGRILLGLLMDRLPAGLAGAGFIMSAALSCALLAAHTAVFAAVLLVGVCAGAEVDLLAFLTSRLFGLRHYAQIYGWLLSVFVLGAGLGPVVAGAIHDEFGTYVAALRVFAAASTGAALLIASLGKNPALSLGLPSPS
jgi:MFS family permease